MRIIAKTLNRKTGNNFKITFAFTFIMLHRILAYHLAALVLLTNIGIPVFTHVCNGQGKEWSSVLLPARSCCSKKKEEAKPCHSIKRHACGKEGVQPKPCCENKTSLAQLHSTFLSDLESWPVKKLEIAPQAFYAAAISTEFSFPLTTCFPFQPHTPPLPLHGRSLLISKQVFRC